MVFLIGYNRCMKTPKSSKAPLPRRILVVDVGGSHVKFRIGPRGVISRLDSGPKMTAEQMADGVTQLVPKSQYDAVSIGYPGLVFHNHITADPHNLGSGWVGFDFAKAFGKPVRLINDAAMQAMGSYEGGRMLFLGLGTGLGGTLIVDGVIEPMELGHMPYRNGRTYEDYVGERGRLRLGTKKWRKVVRDVVDQLSKVLEVDYVIVGGGNAKRLKSLSENERLGDNDNAFVGGSRLWESSGHPLRIDVKRPRAAAK
ncbi:MAG: polyphosphate glucokinase [Gammaproteobacteria bacterium]|nr:polyphosphate glucokinase [Gammaproteobacteria bacterium]